MPEAPLRKRVLSPQSSDSAPVESTEVVDPKSSSSSIEYLVPVLALAVVSYYSVPGNIPFTAITEEDTNSTTVFHVWW